MGYCRQRYQAVLALGSRDENAARCALRVLGFGLTGKRLSLSRRGSAARPDRDRATTTRTAWGGEMLVRIAHGLLGVVLAGGGGYLAWTAWSAGVNVFPPAPDMPWLAIAGVLGLAAGVALLGKAALMGPDQAQLAAKKAEQDAALGAAESYYSQRAHAADRDWRSGDIPPPVAPAPQPVVAAPVVAAPVVAAPLVASPPPAPVSAKPVATSAPPAATSAPPLLTPAPPVAALPPLFPSTANLAPIPAASTPVLAAAKPTPGPPPAAAPPAVAPPVAPPADASPAPEQADPFAGIKAALAAGKTDEAEKLLNAARETAQGLALAELTGLAGDHAAAVGRASNAKWLWRRIP